MKRLAKGLKNHNVWQRGPAVGGVLGGEMGQQQAQQASERNRVRALINDDMARPPTPKKKGNPKKKNKKTPK